MASPVPPKEGGPPSSGPASRSSSNASDPPVSLPEGNGSLVLDQETSPSPPHYPPILGGSSTSSTPPSLRRTSPVTSTTATVTSGASTHKLRTSVSVGGKPESPTLTARRSSDEQALGISSLSSSIGGSSATTVSNLRTPKQSGPAPALHPKPAVALTGGTSSIIGSGATSNDSPTTSGTTTTISSIRRRNIPEEVIDYYGFESSRKFK